jgi:hypothetical protein
MLKLDDKGMMMPQLMRHDGEQPGVSQRVDGFRVIEDRQLGVGLIVGGRRNVRRVPRFARLRRRRLQLARVDGFARDGAQQLDVQLREDVFERPGLAR